MPHKGKSIEYQAGEGFIWSSKRIEFLYYKEVGNRTSRRETSFRNIFLNLSWRKKIPPQIQHSEQQADWPDTAAV